MDTADHTALLQNQELPSKESLESGDELYAETDSCPGRRRSWLPSRALLLVHVGVLLLYTAAFITSLTYVLSSRVGELDIPLSREDLRSRSQVVSRSVGMY
jgi:hypothetical protein